MATVTKQARKKIWALLALGAFTGLLLLPLFLSLPSGASGETPVPAAPAAPAAAKASDAKPVEKSRDVWYKTEGPVVGAPAGRSALSQMRCRLAPHELVELARFEVQVMARAHDAHPKVAQR